MNLSPGKIVNINKFELIVPQVELEIMARGSNNCIVRVSNSLKAMDDDIRSMYHKLHRYWSLVNDLN